MPAPGMQAENLEIQNGPEDEQRPVINLTPADMKPKVTKEDSRDGVPRADERVVDNLGNVVPHEVEGERAVVDDESNCTDKEQGNPRPL